MPSPLQADISAIYTGHADAIYDLSPGRMEPYFYSVFYSASGDHFVACWNRATGTFEQPLAKATSSIYCMEQIPDALLLIGTRSGLIHVVDILQKKALHTFHHHDKAIFDLQYLPDMNCWLSAGEDGKLAVWDARDFSVIQTYTLSNTSIRCLALSPDGKILATGGSDNLVRLFSLPGFEQVAILEGHDNSVFSLSFPYDHTLLSGGRDAHLVQWKQAGEAWMITNKIPAHNFTINHIATDPSQRWVATASRDKTVKIWSVEKLELLKVLDITKFSAAHTHSVNRLLWLSEQELLSAGDDKRIIAWQITA